MPLWQKLRRWLRPSDKPVSVGTKPQVVKPSVIKQAEGSQHPAIDLFAEDQHTTTMLNSITLSSDMKTLYLIDNGRAIPFDLTVPEGVMVGLLGDQLVVATGASKPKGQMPTLPTEGLTEGVVASRAASPQKTTFKVTDKSQYTVTYNPQKRALGIIGFDDLVLSLESPDPGNCNNSVFKLSKDKVLEIHYRNDVLEIGYKRMSKSVLGA